jgi:hypothetical protein
MMNLVNLTVHAAAFGFLAWGGWLSLKCLLRDRTGYSRAGI